MVHSHDHCSLPIQLIKKIDTEDVIGISRISLLIRLSIHPDSARKEPCQRWVKRYFRQEYLIWTDRTIGRNINITLNFVCHRNDKWYKTRNYLHHPIVNETPYSYSTRDMFRLHIFFIWKKDFHPYHFSIVHTYRLSFDFFVRSVVHVETFFMRWILFFCFLCFNLPCPEK